MAFRRKPIVVYQSSVSTDFSQLEPRNSSDGKVFMHKVSTLDVARGTLDPDLFSARNIIASGQVINGNVDFSLSDPDSIERTVERGLTSFINNNPVISEENEN